MPQLSFVTLDVFTQQRYAGNSLAVVRLPAEPQHIVSDEQMLAIAREFQLSETIFIHEGRTGNDGLPEWRVRIFLISEEIPFAGHPTIGCAVYALGTLAKNASRGRFFANAGAIELGLVDGVATASIPHDVHIHTPDAFTLEEFYKLQPVLRPASITEDAIQVVSPVKGMNFVTVELPDIEALAAIATSTGKPKPRLDDNWNVGFSGNYFYVLNSHSNASSASSVETLAIRARMTDGALEHPASGSAACALAASLALKRAVDRTSRYEITQGVEMGRQSDIIVTVTLTEARDAVERVELSGSAVKVMEGVLEC